MGPGTGIDRGNPHVSMQTIFNDGSIHVGVWECTPGGWPIVDQGDTEVASIVSGKGTVTDADGTEHVLLVPGAVVTLLKGYWDPSETPSARGVFT